MHFDHAGIATREMDSMVFLFEDLLDCTVAHEERFDGMEVTFLDVGDGFLELLEPHEEGVIDRYLKNNGPGVHHLAFATEDIDTALERSRDRGVDLVDEQPRQGAWGHDVAFLHPKSTGGVLVEFVEH